jgi:hypothetical protein
MVLKQDVKHIFILAIVIVLLIIFTVYKYSPRNNYIRIKESFNDCFSECLEGIDKNMTNYNKLYLLNSVDTCFTNILNKLDK